MLKKAYELPTHPRNCCLIAYFQANFLRKHFPEVFDVPAELIRAEIETDITIDRQRQEYDPMLGQLLSVLSPDTQDAQARIAVAFAAGQTYSDLS